MPRLPSETFASLADAHNLSARDRTIVASVLVDGHPASLVAKHYSLARQYVDRRVDTFVQRARLNLAAQSAPLTLLGVPLELHDDVRAKVAAYVANYQPVAMAQPEPTAEWRPLPPAASPVPNAPRAGGHKLKPAIRRALEGARAERELLEQPTAILDAFADWDEAD